MLETGKSADAFDIRILADRNNPEFDDALLAWTSFIVSYLHRETSDLFLIEDVTQETLVKIMLNIDRFIPQGNSEKDSGKGWVRTIAVNTLYSYFRKFGREFPEGDMTDVFTYSNDNEWGYSMDRPYQNLEEIEKFRYALDCGKRFRTQRTCSFHMSEEEKKIFMLAFNAGATNKKIATMLDQPVSTVKNTRDYSLKKIKSCVKVQWTTSKCRLYYEFVNCIIDCPYSVHGQTSQELDSLLMRIKNCRDAREGGFSPCELEN